VDREVAWQEYYLSDIFLVKAGKRLTKADMRIGKRPFVGATDSNNGVTNFVSNINKSLDEGVLGVNYNGSVVETFYHPYESIFSDDVKRFSLKDHEANKYVYLFLKATILKQKEKYAYGYKFNETRMSKQKIILPAKQNGEPDFEYMANYARNIETDQLSRYMTYLKTSVA
jgi:restriction endonuclease S subunit